MASPRLSTKGSQRTDIQGLRTIAVGIVVLYHLWPNRAPGGFVGVDVFFVISGFLIVGSLVREAVSSGKINLLAFYARRIRRLLPAASVVLLAILLATVLILPEARWQPVSWDIVMSALQVQNWNQAFSSASYEGATAMVSPVQHYWSLAVEEQFYIVIPVLLIFAVAIARWVKQGKTKVCFGLLFGISLLSFIHSVMFSQSDHDLAYFATTTRIWELGFGGMLAIILPKLKLPPLARLLLGWLSLAMILISVLLLSTEMPFPGSLALLPVLSSCGLIIAGAPGDPGKMGRFGVSALLSLRPMTYVGDISYSLYLWHWPVIVFWAFIIDREPGAVQGAAIVLLCLILAALSQRFIEETFRYGKRKVYSGGRRFKAIVRHRGAYALGAVLVVTVTGCAAVPWMVVQGKVSQVEGVPDQSQYPGAAAFSQPSPAAVPDGIPVRPDPAVAKYDLPLTSKDGCSIYDPAKFTEKQCYYGDKNAAQTVAVVGDSHASQFVDPLLIAGQQKGWNVRAYVRNGCPFSSAPPASAKTVYSNCSEQNKVTLQKLLKQRPELVVMSSMTPNGYSKALHWGWPNERVLEDGYVDLMMPLAEAGIQVVVIKDIPYPSRSIPECVLQNGPASSKCETRIPKAGLPNDPLANAASRVPKVKTLDLTSYLCRKDICPAVVGNVLVYRDNHLTETFAKTMATPLQELLRM